LLLSRHKGFHYLNSLKSAVSLFDALFYDSVC